MKKGLLISAVTLILASVSPIMAQMPAGEEHGPPKALLIVREDIKPGMMAAHNKHSANYVGVFSKLQTPNFRIALAPVAGSENEVVYLTGGDSFADLEKTLNETDKKMANVNAKMQMELDRLDKEASTLHAGMRDILAIYRPDLSFNPGAPIAQMRYFSINTMRIRPGQETKFVDYVQKVYNPARAKAKLPENFHSAVFQVISGAPSGTFLIFRPMKSLSEFDSSIGAMIRNSMSEDMRKEGDRVLAETVISSETSTYAMMPRMSYMPKEFTSMDPDFWAPKTQVATRPKAKPRIASTATSPTQTRP
jgi:hypothetical protein